MITNEQKMVYILTNPELKNWTNETWDDMWKEYIEWCSEMAADNDCSVEEIIEDLQFLDWLEEWYEDQAYTWEVVKTLRD